IIFFLPAISTIPTYTLSLHDALPILLPWLDRCKVRSFRYRSKLHLLNIAQFVVCFVILGMLGALPSTPALTLLAQICSFGYFARSEEHTSELQSRFDLVCRLLLEIEK